MNIPDDRVPIECWWETATTTLDLDSNALVELGVSATTRSLASSSSAETKGSPVVQPRAAGSDGIQ